LSQRHRTVLFLVDGKRSATEVCGMALQAGVPESCFSDLVDMGLIMLAEPSIALWIGAPVVQEPLHVDLPLAGTEGFNTTQNSTLPPSRTLYPESVLTDAGQRELSASDSWLPSGTDEQAAADPGFAEARLILMRAVRAEAPLAGSLTLMRLRRARTRADLSKLLEEVETRITKPHRSLAANQTMRRVRQLLDGRVDSWFARL
jgi:hypothetical protein